MTNGLQYDKSQIAEELFGGEFYATPALARNVIERNTSGFSLPWIGFVRRNRAREDAKRAAREVPRRFEEFNYDKLTGDTKQAKVYVKRRVANEKQPAAIQIRDLLAPATDEGTYRALGMGGWHVTIASAVMDLAGATPDEFAEDIRGRFERQATGLLVPLGGVSILGTRICGNQNGTHGSSRFIGLTPTPDAGLLEEMRALKLVFDPTADTRGEDWFNTPHISVARAGEKLFGIDRAEQHRLEGNLRDAIDQNIAQLSALTLTAACVEISDHIPRT